MHNIGEQNRDKILSLCGEFTDSEIAEQMNMAKSTVHIWLNRLEIDYLRWCNFCSERRKKSEFRGTHARCNRHKPARGQDGSAIEPADDDHFALTATPGRLEHHRGQSIGPLNYWEYMGEWMQGEYEGP